jgi:hypothetical protein
VPSARPSRRIDRSQLPDEFTPESVRAMGLHTARLLGRPGNGILTPTEQAAFDRALREVLQGSTDRLGRSLGRSRRVAPPAADPGLRSSYRRAQVRLDDQAERARRAFPQLTEDWDVDGTRGLGHDEPVAEVEAATEGADEGVDGGDDVSVGTFETEIEQTSDTLEILEQIATIQQQQLENQRAQLLGETRGLFFALAVSVAVIVAGVAPLVEASPDDRRLILSWTAIVCVVAGLIYATVRAVQSRRGRSQEG